MVDTITHSITQAGRSDRTDTFHPKSTPMKLERFRAKMIAAHPEYFITREAAREECRERQLRLLGEEIRFDTRAYEDDDVHEASSESKEEEQKGGPSFGL
jgi:hypothetical protein